MGDRTLRSKLTRAKRVVRSVELLARRELFSLCVDALVVVDVATKEQTGISYCSLLNIATATRASLLVAARSQKEHRDQRVSKREDKAC